MQLGMQSQHKQSKKKETLQDKKIVPPKKVNPKKQEIPSKKAAHKKKPNPPPKEEKKKRKPKKSAEEAKNRLLNVSELETQPDSIVSDTAVIALNNDTMTLQNFISFLLTIILCITLSYLFVTFAADKLTMHWMGV